MSNISVPRRLLAPAIISVFALCAAIGPTHAFAQTAAAQTSQILPPGQNTCQMVSVTNVQPYVYGGVLESFDVTISDTSNGYVGILASVGNSSIPLGQITRWAGSPSGLRIHVDTPDIRVGTGVPVNVVLLSSLPNQPTCITEIAFTVTGSGTSQSAPIPTSIAPATGGSATTQPAGNTGSSGTVPTGNSGTGSIAISKPAPSNTSSTMTTGNSTGTSSALGASVVASSNMNFLNNVCAGSNAYRLWFILLAIYIVIVAVVVFAEPWFLESSVIGSTAAILVPLILLLAFWYFSEACRAASWIPVAACVIAIIGLFLAFREYETPPLLPASTSNN